VEVRVGKKRTKESHVGVGKKSEEKGGDKEWVPGGDFT